MKVPDDKYGIFKEPQRSEHEEGRLQMVVVREWCCGGGNKREAAVESV